MFHVGVIEIVPDKWESKVFHMDPDLMGTACLQNEGDKAVPICFQQDLIMCDCRLTVLRVRYALNDRPFFSCQRDIDCSTLWRDRAAGDRQVFPVESPVICGGGEDTGAYQMLGHHGDPGSVPVEPVAAAEDERLSLLLIVPCKGVCHRVGVMAHGWVDRHSGRFVEDDQIFVLINNIKRQFCRRDFFRRGSLLDVYAQTASSTERVPHIIVDAVDQDAFRHPLNLCDVLGRVAFAPEELFYSKPVGRFADFIFNHSVHCIFPLFPVR